MVICLLLHPSAVQWFLSPRQCHVGSVSGFNSLKFLNSGSEKAKLYTWYVFVLFKINGWLFQGGRNQI